MDTFTCLLWRHAAGSGWVRLPRHTHPDGDAHHDSLVSPRVHEGLLRQNIDAKYADEDQWDWLTTDANNFAFCFCRADGGASDRFVRLQRSRVKRLQTHLDRAAFEDCGAGSVAEFHGEVATQRRKHFRAVGQA